MQKIPAINIETLNSPERIQQLVNRFQQLLDINANINTTFDTNTLLRQIIDVAAIVMEAEASSLALLDITTQELVFHLAEGQAGQVVESMRVHLGQGIAGWVAEKGEMVIVNDVQNDPRFYSGIDEATHFKTRSIVCVPLKRGDRTIGVLQVLNKQEGKLFDQEDLTMFLSLANIAAIAIENSQLYQLLNQTISQLRDDNTRMNYILDHIKYSDQEVSKVKELMEQEGALSGSLAVFSPPNLLQMLANDQKVGVLHLVQGEYRGRIFVDSGRVYHADICGNKPHLTGNIAVYEIMNWESGSFFFRDKEKAVEQTITDSCMHLIIESLRRGDELKLLLETCSPEKIPRITEVGKKFIQADSPEEIQTIFAMIDGQQTLQQMWQTTCFDRHTFFSAIKDLMEGHWIVLK